MEGQRQISELERISLRAMDIQAERDRLAKQVHLRGTLLATESDRFEKALAKLKEGVVTRNFSIGSPIEDYVLANYGFYWANFPLEFPKQCRNLSEMLEKLSSNRRFWHQTTKFRFGGSAQIYQILFLGEEPYSLSPTEIRLKSNSSRIIALESVFFDKKLMWPFVRDVNGSEELVVVPEGVIVSSGSPRLTSQQCEIDRLEKILGENPLALVGFRRSFGLEISPELQVMADNYVHQAAFRAFNAVQENYECLKSNDHEIIAIEERYGSSQRETGMFATRPVIPDSEPDPLLVAMLSGDARTDRDICLRRLATCMDDLIKTGLMYHEKPLVREIGVGKKEVVNLAEYAQHVRDILELGYRDKKLNASVAV